MRIDPVLRKLFLTVELSNVIIGAVLEAHLAIPRKSNELQRINTGSRPYLSQVPRRVDWRLAVSRAMRLEYCRPTDIIDRYLTF